MTGTKRGFYFNSLTILFDEFIYVHLRTYIYGKMFINETYIYLYAYVLKVWIDRQKIIAQNTMHADEYDTVRKYPCAF